MKDIESSLTVDRLRHLLHYDPDTGVWTWLVQNSLRRPAGSTAGEVKASGYVLIGIDGRRYRAHRLAWLYMTGEWPESQIDHINTIRSDNRWANLRAATNVQNAFNRGPNRNNTSGFKGVFWNRQRQQWAAKINIGSQQIHLGFYSDPFIASLAYENAVQQFAGEFGRTSIEVLPASPAEVTVVGHS